MVPKEGFRVLMNAVLDEFKSDSEKTDDAPSNQGKVKVDVE